MNANNDVLARLVIAEPVIRLVHGAVDKFDEAYPWSRASTPVTKVSYAILTSVLRVVACTFNTIKYLCSEASDSAYRPEMSLTTPILARNILDALFLFVFLFEDLGDSFGMVFMFGLAGLAEDLDRSKRDYGSNPNWVGHIRESESHLASMAALIGKSPEDARKTKWWPTPGK